MEKQKQIVDFLCKPENLPIALEVTKHMEAVRWNLLKSFLVKYEKELKARMNSSPINDHWMIAREGDYDSTDVSINIRIKNIPKPYKGSFLSLSLENYRGQLYYGLIWNKEERPSPKSASYKRLIQQSENAGFPGEYQGNWWATELDLGISLTSDELVLQYGLNRAGYIKDLIERIWAYFESIEPDLFQINNELIHRRKKK